MKQESEAMLETWRVKEEAWKEVEHLPLKEAIRERLRKVEIICKNLGFGIKDFLCIRSVVQVLIQYYNHLVKHCQIMFGVLL